MTAPTSGWAVECTPPGHAAYSLTRPCASRGHAAAVRVGLPDHYRPARITSQEARPMTRPSITARVDRGVALFDRALPGWDDRIDLDRLDVASPCRCPLGQEFADAVREGSDETGFDIGADALFGPDARADDLAEYGLEQYSDEPGDGGYVALTAQWRRVIEARRGGAS